MKKGILFLIPTTLGDNGTIHKVLPDYNLEVIRSIDVFIVENLRTARRFIAKTQHPTAIDDMTFFELGKHTPEENVRSFLDPVLTGKSIGLLSEAGTPCIADPGAVVVNYAQELKIKVVPLVGPNSIILALMASGFNGQNFTFHGYLPVEKADLVRKIRQMESSIQKDNQTQIFIETPFRNRKMFETLLSVSGKQTKVCVATDISLASEKIKTLTVEGWKKETVDLHKKPTVFLLFK